MVRRILPLALIALSLAACGADTRRSLGLSKAPPDEFSVVGRAPLELPPDFGLRPPVAGAARPNELTARDQAKVAVFGPTTAQPQLLAGRTAGEAFLLEKAGAPDAQPDIRATVEQESTKLAREERSFVDKLIFWRAPEEPGVAVDPSEEAKRLKENAALGKPATEGETPSMKRKRKGILEGII